MKISQIIQETSTTAGCVAPTEMGFVKMQTRSPSVYGSTKAGNLLKGKKTSKPFANSVNESAELSEADLQEDDIIVIPGQGRIKKTGFIKHDPDRAEHEGETLKNSLHTIVRVASHLNKELSLRDNFPEWVSEKIGGVKSDMVAVMDYLISAKEMQHEPATMEEGKIDFAKKIQKNVDKSNKAVVNTKKEVGSRVADIGAGGKEYNVKTDKAWDDAQKVKEGAKVDRMVKHVAQSEKKLGHSKKEAENIAWATANKRGMLDNKNKKAK